MSDDAKKKPKKKSASSRCLDECRKRGWICDVVERVVPKTFIRRDWCGFGDILALDGQPGSLMIQATTAGARSAHVRKIRVDCAREVDAWLAADNRLQIWTWEKRRVGNRERWVLGITHITREGNDHGEEDEDGQQVERQRSEAEHAAEAQRE